MEKTTENLKMECRCHKEKSSSLKELFMAAPVDAKVRFREAYLSYTGMPYTTFYRKLSEDSFRPLEERAFHRLLKSYPLS